MKKLFLIIEAIFIQWFGFMFFADAYRLRSVSSLIYFGLAVICVLHVILLSRRIARSK